MLLTFNCGIGIVICVAASDEAAVLAHLQKLGEQAWTIGSIIQRGDQQGVVYANN